MQCEQIQQEKINLELQMKRLNTLNNNTMYLNQPTPPTIMQSNEMDIFISRFLRSEQGFDILNQNGWLENKIHNWN